MHKEFANDLNCTSEAGFAGRASHVRRGTLAGLRLGRHLSIRLGVCALAIATGCPGGAAFAREDPAPLYGPNVSAGESATEAAPAAVPEVPAKAAPEAAAKPEFKTDLDRISYAVGIQTGRALRTADGAEVNIDTFVRGLRDGLDAARAQLPERQIADLMGQFQQSLRQKMSVSRSRAKLDNAKAAEEFFKANRKQPGVVTMAGGVQYKIVTTGQGAVPTENDVVTLKYRGTLINGKEFDATPENRPANLTVSSLVAGWKQVLKVMPVGSHWVLYIPPELGYGVRGVGLDVGPNETLIYDVELLATRDTTGPVNGPSITR
jgi:FKBP-type peptidyl-prolyl cis-trans isomerase FklB